jgi:3-deoxy-D-manno-octulosonic-acid transferase
VYFLYSLLLTVGFIALLPKFAIDALRTRKYVTGLSQRLGNLPALPSQNHPVIWIHCVSVGETEAARPLIRSLLEKFPSHQLVVSTTTVTGQKVARNAFGKEAAAVFYFPIDWAWTVRRVLRVLRPAAVLIMETELWPHLLRECSARSIPVALINGRISETSFRRYKWIASFIRRVLNDLTIALMQSEQDAARIRELGLPDKRILMTGNLKFDSSEASNEDVTVSLRKRFAIDEARPLIVAGSTHEPEESILIEAFKQLKSRPSALGARLTVRLMPRLMIAPRHPERFSDVSTLLQKSGLIWARWSDPEQTADASCDVILLDTVGELRAAYPLAAVAFVGGSLAPYGGHNVLEPASLGIPVITGAYTQNFAAITKALLDEDAIVQLPNLEAAQAANELASVLGQLLSEETRRRDIGQRAQAVCNQNRGATERTVQVIESLLAAPATAGKLLPFTALHATTAK